jgi:hypothetical protein
MYIVGEGSDPIYICKRGEIPELFTPEFSAIFRLWKLLHYKIGLPHGPETDPFIVDLLCNMEAHYSRYFSHEAVIVKYMEVLLKSKSNTRGKNARGGARNNTGRD